MTIIGRRGLPALAGFLARPSRAAARLAIAWSDDVTHVLSNLAPWRQNREPLSDALLGAAFGEALDAGADVLLVQPGLGWMPWWRSALDPVGHYQRWQAAYGVSAGGYARFILAGGDVLDVGARVAGAAGKPLLASLRMNDAHGILLAGLAPQQWRARQDDGRLPLWLRYGGMHFPDIYRDHPEWRLGGKDAPTDDPRRFRELLWNWAEPGVRAWRLALVTDLARQPGLAGLELDFMRFPLLFRADVPLDQRRAVMGEFLGAVRERLGGMFGLRLPARLEGWPALGLDPRLLRRHRVDRVVLSSHSFTSQDVDFAGARSVLRGVHLSLEVSQGKHWRQTLPRDASDEERMMLATPGDLLSTATLARRHGFDGLQLFNFVYWRRSAAIPAAFDPSREPPLAVVRSLAREEPSPADRRAYVTNVFADGMTGLALPLRLRHAEVRELSLALGGRPTGRPVLLLGLEGAPPTVLADGNLLALGAAPALAPSDDPRTPVTLAAPLPEAAGRGTELRLRLEARAGSMTLWFVELRSG